MTNNMAYVPNTESGTKCLKMTLPPPPPPQYGSFVHPQLRNQRLIEQSEKIRVLALDTTKERQKYRRIEYQ